MLPLGVDLNPAGVALALAGRAADAVGRIEAGTPDVAIGGLNCGIGGRIADDAIGIPRPADLKASVAACVLGPQRPSNGPGSYPSVFNAFCQANVASLYVARGVDGRDASATGFTLNVLSLTGNVPGPPVGINVSAAANADGPVVCGRDIGIAGGPNKVCGSNVFIGSKNIGGVSTSSSDQLEPDIVGGLGGANPSRLRASSSKIRFASGIGADDACGADAG